MSSYVSTVTINDKEWMEIQRKVSDTEIYLTRKREETLRLRDEIQRRERELREMQEQSKRTVDSAITMLQGSFDKSVHDLPATIRVSLRQQAQATDGELAALKNDIRATAAKTSIASARISKISQGVADILGTLVKQEKDGEKGARVYLDHITSLLEQIERLHPDSFEPRAYMEVIQIVNSAKSNIDAGRYQSSLINVQAGLLKASALLTCLILANASFNESISGTAELADSLKARFDRFDSRMDGSIAFEIDGEKYEFDYDIDHWSEGRFAQLRKAFQTAYEQLQNAKEKRISADKIDALKKTFEELGKRLDRCDASARAEMLGSHRAQETAARLCDRMPEDWQLDKFGFEEEDDRNPYRMLISTPSGAKIPIVISSGASAEKPSVFLEAYAGDEARSEILKKNILATIPMEGLRVEQTKHLPDCQSNPNGNAFLQNTLPKAMALNKQRRQKSFGM